MLDPTRLMSIASHRRGRSFGSVQIFLAYAALTATGWAQEAKAPEGPLKAYTQAIPGSDVTFELVPIPGGTFIMGSKKTEEGRRDDEGPHHSVEIDPFWMGKCEVTWEQYDLWSSSLEIKRRPATHEVVAEDRAADAVTRPTPPYTDMTFGMGHDGYPAICMTQHAARTFCKWLSTRTGRFYRLPTEAEWEYACRAGTQTAYHFGDDPKDIDTFAWHKKNSQGKYHRVGAKSPNAWGLHDMHGNVAEWCLDQHVVDGYGQRRGGRVSNPLTVATELYPRVVRGGSWKERPQGLRSAARRGSDADWKMQDPQIPKSIWYHTDALFVGFRIVRPVREPTKEERARYE